MSDPISVIRTEIANLSIIIDNMMLRYDVLQNLPRCLTSEESEEFIALSNALTSYGFQMEALMEQLEALEDDPSSP